MNNIHPLDQSRRPKCSLPLRDADLALGNANWTKGLQAMSDWIWSANLNPEAFPNHLARFLLHTPGVFEQQLNYSTTLIFDLPSFRNGIQVSGFIDRVTRELVISYIAHRRRAWYSMTHHAVLGRLTTIQSGMSEQDFTAKWSNLLDFAAHPDFYSLIEIQALHFAAAFTTDPKTYTDEQFNALKEAIAIDLTNRYRTEAQWLERIDAGRRARAQGLSAGDCDQDIDDRIRFATNTVRVGPTEAALDQQVYGAIIELAFLCLQFTALSCVFSGLNIPDEEFLGDVMQGLLPDKVIQRLNELCELGGDGLDGLLPPPVDINLDLVISGRAIVAPASLQKCRLPMVGYEVGYRDRDRGVTVGGIQVGVYGWGFGAHFPGSLAYALMHHPELARFEAPYSLPLLFNEDEWRNGVQTSGYVSRLLKEIVIQKVYKTNRSRYGLEHHTIFLYNAVADEFGIGRWPVHAATDADSARAKAIKRAEAITLYVTAPDAAPANTFSDTECAVLAWTDALMRSPHSAYEHEPHVRTALDAANRREVARGDRHLDTSGNVGEDHAFGRLLDHQIAELAMMIGHMDGLGRALTILQLPAELPVRAHDGYFQDRPGLHDVLPAIGVSAAAMTVNELTVNPKLAMRLSSVTKPTSISADEAAKTGEY